MSDTKRPDQGDDIEGHTLRGSWSDERLKEAISSLETAQGSLHAVRTTRS